MGDTKYDASSMIPASFATEHPDEMAIKCVVIIEGMDGDGHTILHVIKSNECQAWQALGLTAAARMYYEQELYNASQEPDDDG